MGLRKKWIAQRYDGVQTGVPVLPEWSQLGGVVEQEFLPPRDETADVVIETDADALEEVDEESKQL